PAVPIESDPLGLRIWPEPLDTRESQQSQSSRFGDTTSREECIILPCRLHHMKAMKQWFNCCWTWVWTSMCGEDTMELPCKVATAKGHEVVVQWPLENGTDARSRRKWDKPTVSQTIQ